MRPVVVILLLAALLPLFGCQQCSDPTPWPALADQPLGARCERASQCAAGLDCLDSTCTVPCPDGTCTVPCPGASCPQAVCFDRRYCLPGCAGDGDCLMGTTMGGCNLHGAGPPYCHQRGCQSDAECLVGAVTGRCAGFSRASGITWNESCSTGTCVR